VEGPEDQRGGTVKGVGEKGFLFTEADNGFSTLSPSCHLRPRTMHPLPHLHKVRQLEGILLVEEMSTKPFAVYEMGNGGLVPVDHSAKCSWTVRQVRREYAPSVGHTIDSFLVLRYSGLHCLPIPDRKVRSCQSSLSGAPQQGMAHKAKVKLSAL
jgi:hypothetical protein